jgi:hypothetical protein
MQLVLNGKKITKKMTVLSLEMLRAVIKGVQTLFSLEMLRAAIKYDMTFFPLAIL